MADNVNSLWNTKIILELDDFNEQDMPENVEITDEELSDIAEVVKHFIINRKSFHSHIIAHVNIGFARCQSLKGIRINWKTSEFTLNMTKCACTQKLDIVHFPFACVQQLMLTS